MPALLDKRLIVVTGKGGVGRTTIAAALGLAAARAGKRTMIAEVAQQERLSRAFRREGLGYSEAKLADNLWGMSIDPEHALKEYLGQQVGGPLGGLLVNNRIFEYFTAAAPGVRRMPSPCPVEGESTITRSYGAAVALRRWSCASSQIFPMVTSSRMPGVAAAKYWKKRLSNKSAYSAEGLICERRYSSIDSCGSTDIA